MKILLVIMCMFFTSGVYAAGCVTNARGKTVCGTTGSAAVVATPNAVVVNPSSTAVVVNPNTNTAVKAQTNVNGVTHTQTSRGGEAVTKNGKGVAQGPGGTTCAKTARNQGCR
ncbi:MAG: hypothetical protein LUQ18_05245 [Methylococcaceae bacterium]|nr:hypothetical protein [Methylococcaceae bacterium]